MGIGFGNESDDKSDIYSSFIGTPGHYSCGNFGVTGVLREVNRKDGYFSVQPSIVLYGELGIRLEKEIPTVVSMLPGNSISVRPLQQGDLETIIIEARNKQKKKIIY